MRKTLTILAAALGASMTLPSNAVDAATPQAGTPVTIAAGGEGPWYIRCEINGGGDLVELSTARPAYTDSRLRSATCRYQANRTPLTISVTGAGWACPFRGAQSPCQLVVRRFGEGEFRLAQAAH